jgi:L-threonylcarbamoyladenylate synthase
LASSDFRFRYLSTFWGSNFSTLSLVKRASTPLLRPSKICSLVTTYESRLAHRSHHCPSILQPNPTRGTVSSSVMNGVFQARLEESVPSSGEISPNLELRNGCHSNSDTSPPPSTATPPYRRTVQTTIEAVDSNSISFRPPSNTQPGVHLYENPILTVSSEETRLALESAAELLLDGQCVAFPTETVYGLGADATCTAAVRSIYAAKSRPADNPLIVHISSLKQLRTLLPSPFSAARLPTLASAPEEDLVEEETIPKVYLPLIEKFWPGPLTILLPLPTPSPLSPNVTSIQTTFAARMPGHPIALALSAISGLPLAAPSANASGKPSPTKAKHVYTDLHG